MAAPGGKFFIHDKLSTPAVHHNSFKDLWESKWKKPCEMGVYPFMFGCVQDFQPIVDELVAKDFKEPYNWDEYAPVYFPYAKKIAAAAEKAEQAGEKEKASELYLRASAVYRISRFPAPRSEQQRYAWKMGKEACLKGLQLREHPVEEVQIPHKHAIEGEGSHIPVYYQVPEGASKANPVPLIIIITGLDGYRTELCVWMESWRRAGCASLVVEIPGTGDSPAAPKDPKSPDRQWSSLFDWVERQEAISQQQKVVWAYSTGGYYAIRMAHTHADKLAGVVALGGGTHHMFDVEWLDNVNKLEYPFDLATTLCYKYGYGSDFETFKKEASDKFSLLKDGTLDTAGCTRLFLVNGTEDEIFPIDDYYLALQHGDPKEARFVPNRKHMGEPESFAIILRWIYKLLGIQGNVIDFLKLLPFKPKFEVEDYASVKSSEKSEAGAKDPLTEQSAAKVTHSSDVSAVTVSA